MINYIKKNKLSIISILVIIALCILLLFYFFDLSKMDINVPLFYNGDDSFMGISNTKMLLDGNSIITSNNLGAPFNSIRYDYLSLLMDNFDNLVTNIIVHITGNVGFTFNIQYLLLFPFISLISFFVMRELKIKYFLSILGSVTFAFLPYIFLRNQAHIVLSEYQFIPLAILLCIWIYNDDDIFRKNKQFIKNKKNILAILFLILIANNGIAYYPFFTCFFLLITGLSKSIKLGKLSGLKQSISMIVLIVFCFIINLIPSIVYIMQNGSNFAVANRSKIEAEIYGLKITQLFFPNKSLHIPILNKLITYYGTNAPLPNEGSEHLGVIGCIGLLLLLLALFIRINKEKQYLENIKLFSELNIFAILLGTIGGFGSIFSLTISSSIRGYNRISVFIAFICILSFCVVINEISKKHFKPYIFYPLIGILFLFSIYEQYPNVKPNYVYAQETFYSDKSFVENIENSVPDGAMIFQLPYHKYPESGPVNAMNDYHLFTGFIHSENLKWSYGGIKGRNSDLWNQKVSSLSTSDMVKTVSLAGFEGIYIDKRAYSEADYNKLNQELISILQVSPLYSQNNQLAFFNMTQYNEAYKALYSKDELEELSNKVLEMNSLQLGIGFTGIEGIEPDQWIWLSNNAEIIVNNSTDKTKPFNLKFDIASSAEKKSSLEIKVNDKIFTYKINLNGVSIDEDIILNQGNNSIKFITDAPRVYAPGDPRELYLRITNFYNLFEKVELK